jgi:replicative DNA helicase
MNRVFPETNGHANGNGHAETNGHGVNRPVVASLGAYRLPPHNLEAEQGAIGSMLLDQSCIDDVMPLVNPGDFYRDSHQILSRHIFDMRSEGLPVDSLMLEEHLRLANELDRIGGLDAILGILDSVPHSANAAYYAQIVREKSVARELIEAANSLLRACYSNNFTADELKEAAERSIFAVSDGRESRDTSSAIVATAEALAEIEARRAGKSFGLTTGLADLDDFLCGVEGSSLTLIGARPSNGKTALGLQWAYHVTVAHRLPALFFSIEMPRRQLGARLLSLISGIDGRCLKTGKRLQDEDMGILSDSQASFSRHARLEIDGTPSMSASSIASAARKFKSRHGLGIVFVDYVGLVQPEDPKAPRHQQVALISRRMKTLARDLDVPVVLLCQLNRGLENREDHRPRMSDLKESGDLEQDADAIIMPYRPEVYNPEDSPGMAELIVTKNRNGVTGVAEVVFQRSFTRFANYQEEFNS